MMQSFFFSGAFEFIFFLIFALIIGVFIMTFVRGLTQWHQNNNSPRLTVPATIVAKRVNVTPHHHNNAGDATGAHGGYTTSSTSYYVTFQFESSDRQEFMVNGSDYGLLAEGDDGQLTFQGTRYLDFERQFK